jgi:murein DD-endopeptidase MepM/ murein hydrolase activator NlpD
MARAGALLEAATTRAQAAAQQLTAANEALPGAHERVGEARGRVAAATGAALSARREVAAAAVDLDRANSSLDAAKAKVDGAREELGNLVTAAYKGSGIVTLNVLVEARTPTQLADRLGYLDFVVNTQRAALDKVLVARLAAKQASNVAVLAQRRAAAAQEAADAALADARLEQAGAERAAADLAVLSQQRTDALAVAAQERTETLARYDELKAESERVAEELRDWEARQQQRGPVAAPVLRPGAKLLMPVQGWKSSDFGMRYDPYYGVWQLHAGVDLAAGGGQPIYAAADGQVTRAGWNGGYGNYTCIYHGRFAGRSMATCYAHQSEILVDEGQRVRRGQLIGRVGTTGASTGYHLHFEVRLDGTPVQPLDWLPICLC